MKNMPNNPTHTIIIGVVELLVLLSDKKTVPVG